jgi:hypothetical protein
MQATLPAYPNARDIPLAHKGPTCFKRCKLALASLRQLPCVAGSCLVDLRSNCQRLTAAGLYSEGDPPAAPPRVLPLSSAGRRRQHPRGCCLLIDLRSNCQRLTAAGLYSHRYLQHLTGGLGGGGGRYPRPPGATSDDGVLGQLRQLRILEVLYCL